DRQQLVLGGDHLGPQVWRRQGAAAAMLAARDMVRAYAQAGFRKIHLDCSEPCADDVSPLSQALCAERAAQLAAECESAAPDAQALAYVIGTEVPRPGGAFAEEEALRPTRLQDAEEVIELHREAFARIAPAAWERVIALVVQPGMEFSPQHVSHYEPAAVSRLESALRGQPRMCFEAHSTDYQRPSALAAIAAKHFAILKIGPALTDACRSALYRLDALKGPGGESGSAGALAETLERLMLADDKHWREHYRGTPNELTRLRHHSYADRIRYYWPQHAAEQAVATLYERIDAGCWPAYVLRDVFTAGVLERAEALQGIAGGRARSLVFASIQDVLLPYFRTRA
ncbi:MAG TPA: class II D-tagatose-bisphosphate aldolase, non-catalytic subunit, partial [Acidiferrobacteraceae bacterium]|nr:class II D-tagatose-bisphosphate aldolase, non-catalytic subunit [Acidiferrobacteraceae bacterium]